MFTLCSAASSLLLLFLFCVHLCEVTPNLGVIGKAFFDSSRVCLLFLKFYYRKNTSINKVDLITVASYA